MLSSQMLALLVVLCSSMLLVRVRAAPQMNELTETLEAELITDKDLAGLFLLRFMSELMASGGEETLGEPEEELGGSRRRLTRRHIRLTHRERKAGCRNFFWKTFTSC